MEAEADLVNYGNGPTLDKAFEDLVSDDDIENELAAIKSRSAEKDQSEAS